MFCPNCGHHGRGGCGCGCGCGTFFMLLLAGALLSLLFR